jgi:flagellin
VEGDDTNNSSRGDLVKGTTANDAITSTFAAATRIAGTTFDINGSLGTATVDYLTTASAKDVAAAVNAKTSQTGVTATAKTEIQMSVLDQGSSFSIDVTSDNSTAITVAFTTQGTSGTDATGDQLSAAVQAFNDVSAKTGVTAHVDDSGTRIVLSNSSGNNITLLNNSTDFSLSSFTGANGAIAVAAVASGQTRVVVGELALDSDKAFNVSGATTTDWFSAATTAGQQQTVQYADVSSKDAANRSIAMIDGALANVASQRARYGALQNRFETTVTSLQTTSENLSASRSRIQDADFAQETANLTRAQILQQAGIAMLAQANALPNQVLTLLRG